MEDKHREKFNKDFDEFYEAVIECACWSSGEGEEFNQPPTGLDEEIMKAHAMSFFSRMYYYVQHEKGDKTMADAGHDFWLTSQGHGAGFWDGGWPIYGEMLTKLSKCYPEEMDKHLSKSDED